ncbi:MAG TPA: Crp/Fnr family transcriptional regulator [Noviherbaspirillum sp.]|jgi:CRP-like cAMP-binding protein|uniref:Crp/Fnr family transcriptional regulator n=1 Tax=Noviherbaspirillum sp. TaxID=1926288 RepID=UPI002DDCB034|nr:Crp/Fnr family transcriptional regulator [Noviherbaspirillum sp.]HEV2612598.1 Crp/Fnr family transcriptional regulator [Noviherbaspirillum sp.]
MSATLTEARRCQNRLLAKLSDDELQPLLPLFSMVETKLKDVLYRQHEPIEYVYFPCTSAHSCTLIMEDGFMVEVGTTGNESFTGVELLLDATLATETAICQVPGTSMRMKVTDFRKALAQSKALRKLLKCAGQAYLAQVSQGVACNRLHSLEARFARWLLITHDRVQGKEFHLTQEFLAAMLGVHRPSVSLTAGTFQQAGIIRYTRGHMTIVDRKKLEEISCECYAVVRGQFERLLGVPHG